MLQRARASRWVRCALLVLIVGCCAYGVVREWPEVRPSLARLHVYSLAGSLMAAIAASACMMLAWRAVLADLGSRLPVLTAARVTFISQLGKYVPGAIWSFAAHVELGHDYEVPRRRGAASVLVSVAVAVAVGLLIAAITLPLVSPAVARRYVLVLLAVPVIAVCLAPPVLSRLIGLGLRLCRQPPLEQPVSWRGLGIVLAWTTAGWLFLGLQVWLLVADVARDGVRSLLLSLAAYALACSLALLLVVFPNGIGARELILVAALAPLLPSGPALAVALVARLVATVSDLTWGLIALLIGRVSLAATPRPAIQAGTSPGDPSPAQPRGQSQSA